MTESIVFTVLSSGSSGNATLVKYGEILIMIDAGLSVRKLEKFFLQQNVMCQHLNAIVVTHEHIDHIRGLGGMCRKYNIPIYANENTWNAMDASVGTIDLHLKNIIQSGEVKKFGNLRVKSFGVSHDAAEPVGYCFYDGKEKLSIVTDLGYVSDKVAKCIEDSDVIVLEANHDIELLRIGHYPWHIKRRILSDVGHLSNEAAGEALTRLCTDRTKRVYLAHLSKQHNMMDLAQLTVKNVMHEKQSILKNNSFRLCSTYHDRPTSWDNIAKP